MGCWGKSKGKGQVGALDVDGYLFQLFINNFIAIAYWQRRLISHK